MQNILQGTGPGEEKRSRRWESATKKVAEIKKYTIIIK